MTTVREDLVEALQDAADVLGCMSVNSLARREFHEGALKTLGAARLALARARAEPEECSCNDCRLCGEEPDECSCFQAGYQMGTGAQRERV